MFLIVSKILCRWASEYGGVYRARVMHTRLNVVTDPKIIESISTNPKVGKPFVYKFLDAWLGDSLIIASGDRWSKLRRLITPAFHFQILEDYVKTMDEQAKVLVSKISETEGKTIDFHDYAARFAMDVICETAMGIKCGAQHNDMESAAYRDACSK